MTNIPNMPDAILWHEGMLLAPQHFQQAAQRSEALVQYHVGRASPFYWGVQRLAIDPVLLVNGTLRVTELEAVLPDGLLVTHTAGGGQELSVDLRVLVEQGARGPITVHLVVPSPRGANEPIAGSLPRYVSIDGDPVVDEHTGEGAIAMPRLRPRASLLAGDTAPDKYVSMPIARVQFRDQTFSLTDFIPPLLTAAPHTALNQGCSQLVRRVREKAVFLSEKVRAQNVTVRESRVLDLQKAVEHLTAGLPALEALLASGASHPFPLFVSLCTLAGHLAGVSAGTVPPLFRAYDHNDLRATFDGVIEFCGRMLERVHESYSVVTFHFEDDSFKLGLQPGWVQKTLVIGAVAKPGMTDAEVIAWMESARIGSESTMASIKERRIRGAGRTRIEAADELGLVPSRGVLLFRVQTDPELIQPGATLMVSHPAEHTGAARPAELVLYTGTGA